MRISATATRVVIALVLGFATWMIVTWEQNPFREAWLPSSIPIEVAHLPSGLVEVGKPGDVRLRLRAGQGAWSRVQPNDFKASIDLTKFSAGIHTANVKVETSGAYQVVEWQPSKVTVRLEPLVTRTIPVQLRLTGKLPDGYILQSQSATPSEITISGRQDLVQSISQGAVSTNLDGVHGDVTDTVVPQLLDDKGQPVTGVQLAPNAVRISLQVNHQVGIKTVPVRLVTQGQVASGYWLSSLSVTPQTVQITGGPAALGKVDYLDLPPLNLNGAKAPITRDTKLAANSGYSIVGASDVQVKAVVQPLRTTEVLPLGISVQGLGPGLEATLSPTTVQVTLGGLAPTLSSLKPGDVSASVSVAGLGPGQHALPIRLNAPGSVSLDATKPDRVTVTLVTPATATPSTAATPSPPPSGSTASQPSASPPSAGAPASPSASAAPSTTPAASSATPSTSPGH